MDDSRSPDEPLQGAGLPSAPAGPSRTDPSPSDIERAFVLARVARGRARAPYSHFSVGAAILTDGGALFPGCNVENASFGLTTCAERNALGGWTASTEPGDRGVVILVVIVTGADEPTAPCGACRQWLVELAPEAMVVAEAATGKRTTWTVRELLPDAFDGSSLPANS